MEDYHEARRRGAEAWVVCGGEKGGRRRGEGEGGKEKGGVVDANIGGGSTARRVARCHGQSWSAKAGGEKKKGHEKEIKVGAPTLEAGRLWAPETTAEEFAEDPP